MGIAVLLVDKNLKITVQVIDSIDINTDFYKFRNIAREEGYFFLGTLDDTGDTVFNYLQLPYLEKEMQLIRKKTSFGQQALEILEHAICAMREKGSTVYIRCIGD